ncbi:polysaccharide biosynthesis/export family protein [Oceanicaulis alexandrii]|uniref:polysaccharide biosynthesis/export family protein n=1 Tax=Oceanicaulis alexandrii TaxID=153233 RepID=UPI003BB212AC
MFFLRAFLVTFSFFALVACTATSSPTRAPASDPSLAVGTEPTLAPAYVLGSGDQLRIIVFGEDNLSGEFFIDGAGMVSLPLVGEVAAAGKTVAEFRTELEARLSDGYLNDPRVSAEVLNYRPFYILGEVEESGEYPYTDGLTVMNAVARAGGFTYRANTRVVFIKRANTNAEIEVPLSATVRVMPGDTIRIAERFF